MKQILMALITSVHFVIPTFALDLANPMLPAVTADKFCYPDAEGANFYCRQDNGEVVWCYPRKNRRYFCPRKDKKAVWCFIRGNTHYCPTDMGTWWFIR